MRSALSSEGKGVGGTVKMRLGQTPDYVVTEYPLNIAPRISMTVTFAHLACCKTISGRALRLTAALAILCGPAVAYADDIGCVSTDVRMLGIANDKICVAAFKYPDVDGVVCHISRAETGGAKGMIGIAEDTSDASISCKQVGPITLKGKLADGDKVFKESRSLWFKSLQVVRFFDKPNNTLIYLSYSDKLIDGSPKNAISTVPLIPWPSASPN